MITKYNGAESQKMMSTTQLPKGGYVAEVKNVRIEEYSWGDVLILAIDICEGEYKNFFKQQYENDDRENKKWKGTFRINIPSEKSKYPESDRRKFNNLIYSFENSNPNFIFDWDEQKLKNKIVGVIYRNKQFMKDDGTVGDYSEAAGLTDVQSIRDNTYSPIKDKMLTNSSADAAQQVQTGYDDIADEDLPF